MNDQKYNLREIAKVNTIALTIGVVGLVVSVFGYFLNSGQFFHSYLTAFSFWVLIALGGLFLTILHHLTGAEWSVVLRRFFENTSSLVLPMAILFIPILLGLQELYSWTDKYHIAADKVLLKKAPYLNAGFFIVRAAFFFAIWILLSRVFLKESLRQDAGLEANHLVKAKKFSAIGVILFALTMTYASFDWIMSLDPHWYSTIFGLYVFSGSTLSVLAFLILVLLYLRKKGILTEEITVEHFHDLGKLLFTFTIFWAYMAFSQYFLIWYGNIPEETIWFQHRWQGSWKTVSLVLVMGHFVLPFIILMIRSIKRNLSILGFMAFWLLLMHFIDLYWLILPGLHQQNAQISWMDFTTVIGIGGIFIWYFARQMSAHALIPINDPRLQASIHTKSH